MTMTKRKVSHILLLLVALLQMATPSSAQNSSTTTSTTTTTTAISTTSTSSTSRTSSTTSTSRTSSTASTSGTSSTTSASSTSSTSSNSTTSTTIAAGPTAPGYSTGPANITVAVGEPVVFSCGVPVDSPSLSFTLHSSQRQFTLTCPNGHVEDIPQAVYGSCDVKNGESLAVWTLRGTSFSDNGTKVVCHQSDNPVALVAVLQVYDNGASYAVLIGCLIGGFFGILVVCGLSYLMLWRSDSFRRCFGGEEVEDDLTMVVTKDSFKKIES